MPNKKLFRVYPDTSVFGGCYDEEFSKESLRLIRDIRHKKYILLLTDVVIAELQDAPEKVSKIIASIPTDIVERIQIDAEVLALRDAYISAGIVGIKWSDDATHVAAATVARADALVSWNFRHIVRLDKMKLYNQINLLNGYGILTIISPKELTAHGKE
jgi:hypothetical protein